MASTLAPPNPRSANTRAAASISAERVSACRCARVNLTYVTVSGYDDVCELAKSTTGAARDHRADGARKRGAVDRRPDAVVLDHRPPSVHAADDGPVRARACRHRPHGRGAREVAVAT